MTEPSSSNKSVEERTDRWGPAESLELWKHFGGIGSNDKNTMVTVNALLLTLSLSIIGYSLANLSEPKAVVAAVVGIVLAVAVAYVAVLYAGYSNWNWAQADAIARARREDLNWRILLPENSTAWLKQQPMIGNPSRSCAMASRLGRPCLEVLQLQGWSFGRVSAWGFAGHLYSASVSSLPGSVATVLKGQQCAG